MFKQPVRKTAFENTGEKECYMHFPLFRVILGFFLTLYQRTKLLNVTKFKTVDDNKLNIDHCFDYFRKQPVAWKGYYVITDRTRYLSETPMSRNSHLLKKWYLDR